VHEIAERVFLADPTVSFHLAKLAEAGLVSVTREGQFRIYQLKEDVLQMRLSDLVCFPDAAAQRQELESAACRDKVLATYVHEGRLRSIPAQRKKRRIVLEIFAQGFLFGRRYSEAEVTTILGRWHEDSSTLRRELVDEQLLQRDHGIYWRP